MDSNQLLVSVILCNYNYGRFIANAIDSVLSQTYSNFELIIVDDGSEDNSRQIIAGYNDPRVRAIFQENMGQGAAFNTGFAVTKGDIVSFLDSDDWWKTDKIENVIRWHEFLQGDYAVLQHGLEIWDNGNIKPYKNILPVGDCFAEMQTSGRFDFFAPTTGLSFPKRILDQIFPIPDVFRLSADAYVMRTAFVFGKVISIPSTLGFYRKHENAVFGNKDFVKPVFNKELLYPALNRFYQTQGINFYLEYPENKKPKKRGILSRFRRLFL